MKMAWLDRIIARPGRTSLRSKLVGGFVAVVGLTLLVGGASLWSQRRTLASVRTYIDVDERISELSGKSATSMLKARQHEKDFMLKVNEYGFFETRSRYGTLLKTEIAAIRENMEAIRRLSADPETAGETRKIEEAAGRYEAGFLRVMELYGRLGYVDTGLEGRFRGKAHEIETEVARLRGDLLLNDLLTLRRHEKDFLLRGKERHAREFARGIDRFKADVARAGLPPASMERLDKQADDYRRLFGEYVRVRESIRAETTAYLTALRTVEPLLEDLHERTEHREAATRDTVERLARATGWTIAIASVCAVFAGLAVAFVISRRIVGSVSACMDFAGRIAQGELESRMAPGEEYEFRTLSAALNDMADALQSAHRAQEERRAELEETEEEVRRLNEGLERKVEERTRQLFQAREELVRREKLAILGQLAGSVGHELRNPLGVMSNAVYFLKMVLTDADETVNEYLDIIKNEVDTSQRIITDLLDFARTRKPESSVIPVHELIGQCMGRCMIPRDVAVRLDLPKTLPPLKVDPLQMGQVFQNLITNAVQAMPDGGALCVAARRRGPGTGDQGLGNNPIPNSQSPIPDDFVEISVVDTGEGISPENMQKLFQPLFTTKAKGMGLGLVVCRNLAEANGGRIEVASRPGDGTTFTVILPVERSET